MPFFLKELSLTITLHPSYFGPRMQDYLKAKLLADVEGTCSGQYGYIICVLDSNTINIDKGRVVPGQGYAEFEVKYRAVLWRPFRGEVVDAVVTTVNKMGFFADIGPLSVFVSSHLVPPDMRFDPAANPPNYSGEDQVIERGSNVRLKIVGTRTDATEIFAIATMKEDYLGVL
ncbi:DNA-directed RNA polymerase complex II subunit Rpb7 [Schizosaccharomyces osmophilus]|uniref:DNA-directed RNA polymerase subunit n=2 Tax=Schizosaccharomyces TaxID=4895 RepID=S9QZ11_SCHOY|nr:DNA-directed RNA polymerase complex II subunit Rpb7 [Schizosaccharomyces octosporus yFS286]XP_056034796.1 DNA-directed RNA polymerase complex II subunit Rpb7 [Schizosaccharomyces osmophilus]EPX71505.1 DNA-directed RNA polymerase complex II subunit Rpb7 [Schizosaccharomyces octosporus yFS286]WBW70553.1 DNA-directed RNA polymerase complex II subunit Rpb7 [Schizosaccharomyces osmophilus]